MVDNIDPVAGLTTKRPRVVWGVGYIFKQQEALLALVVTSQGRTMVTVRHSDSDVVAMMMLITVHCA